MQLAVPGGPGHEHGAASSPQVWLQGEVLLPPGGPGSPPRSAARRPRRKGLARRGLQTAWSSHSFDTRGSARESPRVTQWALAPRSEGSLGRRPRGTGRASLAGSTARLVPPPQARAGRAGPQAGTCCGRTPGSHSTTEPHPRNSSSGATRKEEKRLPFAPDRVWGGCEEGRERGERGGERRGGGRSGDGLRDSGLTWPRGGQRQGSWGPQIRCRCPGGLQVLGVSGPQCPSSTPARGCPPQSAHLGSSPPVGDPFHLWLITRQGPLFTLRNPSLHLVPLNPCSSSGLIQPLPSTLAPQIHPPSQGQGQGQRGKDSTRPPSLLTAPRGPPHPLSRSEPWGSHTSCLNSGHSPPIRTAANLTILTFPDALLPPLPSCGITSTLKPSLLPAPQRLCQDHWGPALRWAAGGGGVCPRQERVLQPWVRL